MLNGESAHRCGLAAEASRGSPGILALLGGG